MQDMITDKAHTPTPEQLCAYTESPLPALFLKRMEEAYAPRIGVDYSGDKVLLGWNMRLYKAGRTLCRLYPRKGLFHLLVVIGQKEKARAEAMLPSLCPEVARVYRETVEGMGQRWLLFTVTQEGPALDDICRLIALRRTGG